MSEREANLNSGAFDQDVLASPVWFGLSLELEPLCVGRLSTQSNSHANKEKVFARAHHLMQNGFHNHHPSPQYVALGSPPGSNPSSDLVQK
ncbi:hypothetical protein L6164_033986 [Bauhinia variegata]|uniref:Uncharacterized protein n=1 Tax=Bauhinia variegata TaxID=167791 RepID=A0ACB9KTJ1_BAUVA|nr:hypothetical protein L6164_033986 [Bauhinia variegata]